MKPMVNVTGISPDTLALLNGAEIPARITFSETTIHIQINLPPPVDSSVEHLRREFAKIESHFSSTSLEIMRYLLTFPIGQANRKGLMQNVWGRKGTTFGAIRQAVRRLNTILTIRDFGYIVRGSRKGIYRFVPLER